MSDTNECRLAGNIDRVRRIDTRTGNVMAEVILVVNQSRFRVVGFGNVGQRLLSCVAGERLAVTGQITTSSWRDATTGEWKNSWGITAWGAEIDGEKTAYQRQEQRPAAAQPRHDIPTVPDGAYF